MSVFPFTEHDGLCECAEKAEFDAMMSSGGFSNIYYIGASWFIKDKCAFVVKPKVEVDYIKLFMTALELNSENEAAYFSNYYYIDFEKPAIKTNALDNVITPRKLAVQSPWANPVAKAFDEKCFRKARRPCLLPVSGIYGGYSRE